MVSFICSLWGDKYSPEYVQKLHNAVKRYYDGEFKFYCQTDRELNITGVEELPFLHFLPVNTGRFPVKAKVNLWKPAGWGITGRKVYLDLDILISGKLNPIIDSYKDKPLIAKSWWQDKYGINEEENNYLAYRGIVNSSIIVWEDSDYTREIWECFEKYNRYIFFCCINGQDGYLSSMHLDKFDFIPHKYVASYHNEPIEGASIILFDTKRNHITYGTQSELHELKGLIKDMWV